MTHDRKDVLGSPDATVVAPQALSGLSGVAVVAAPKFYGPALDANWHQRNMEKIAAYNRAVREARK